MTDIILESASHDLEIVNGDIKIFDTAELATVQKLKIRLLSYRGEWFRDISTGVPYLQAILGKRNTKLTADTVIKNEIITTDNIASITSYTSSINSERKLSITFSAIMTSGGSIENISLEI